MSEPGPSAQHRAAVPGVGATSAASGLHGGSRGRNIGPDLSHRYPYHLYPAGNGRRDVRCAEGLFEHDVHARPENPGRGHRQECSHLSASATLRAAYLLHSVVHDNERLANEVDDELRHAAVLANFRHAFDLYTFVNAGRPRSQCSEDLHFTATVPFWWDGRAVQDERQLEKWLATAQSAQEGVFSRRRP